VREAGHDDRRSVRAAQGVLPRELGERVVFADEDPHRDVQDGDGVLEPVALGLPQDAGDAARADGEPLRHLTHGQGWMLPREV